VERLSASLRQVRTVLAGFSTRQKVALGIAAALTLGVLGWIVLSAASVPYRMLYSQLDPASLAEIVEALDESQIPYRLPSDSAVEVPAERLHAARIMLAGRGLPGQSGAGFELFDDADFGMTTFTQRVNYQRAMEAELARTIGNISAVRSARVHLVLPEERLFREEQEPPSASVVLTLNGSGNIAESAVQGIRYLVSSAVEGLEPRQVTIVDDHGNMLARSSDTEGADMSEVFGASTSLETQLEERIVRLLTPIVGTGSVRATVRVELDTTQFTETTEAWDPNGSVARSSQRSEESSDGPDGAVGGAPGANGGLVGGQEATARRRSEEQVTYEIGSTIRQTSRTGYQMRRVTTAVVLNRAAFEPEGSGQAAAAAAPIDPATLQRLTDLVQNAVGYDEARGDEVVVTLTAFAEEEEMARLDEGFFSDPNTVVSLIRYGALLVVVLLVGIFFVLPLTRALRPPKEEKDKDKKKKGKKGEDAAEETALVPAKTGAAAAQSAPAEGEAELVVRTVSDLEEELFPELAAENRKVDPMTLLRDRMIDEIAELSQKDLDRASQLVGAWLHDADDGR
jgi:flagellar M-ring protein FliF